MGKALPKIQLNPSRDIPFDKLVLSQSNVRRIKDGVSIEHLADSIERRGLLHGLNVRPQRDETGAETGLFEIPAGGRRYRALKLLVKRKRLASTALVPCVVKTADDPILAEEDSLAENAQREQLHPLDEYRAMKTLVDKGEPEESIAAHFRVTPAYVRQRLRLASVSPALHEEYAADRMKLDQLMAFTVTDDHARQEQVWEILAHSQNKSPGFIRDRLTEATVPADDPRALFIGVEAYVQAGGCILRDLFEDDRGGWLQDSVLLDHLVAEKLKMAAATILAEGWKWTEIAVELPYGFDFELRQIEPSHVSPTDADLAEIAKLEGEAEALEGEWEGADEIPDEVDQKFKDLDAAIERLREGTFVFDPAEMANAGAFVTIDGNGDLYVERGWVRPEDEPVEADDTGNEGGNANDAEAGACPAGTRVGSGGTDQPGAGGAQGAVITIGGTAEPEIAEEEDDVIKPLPDRLVSELTAERTLALQDAFAQNPSVAFVAVLHNFVLALFYHGRAESCLALSLSRVGFPFQGGGLKNCAAAKAIEARHAQWKGRLPDRDAELWDALHTFDGAEQAALFAHCAAYGVNALFEAAPRYDNGRVSAYGVARRIAHSHVLARAVGLDMVGAGWRPTAENYFGKVTKARIIEAVAEGKGDQTASLIDHLKKADMVREAERLMVDAEWLPEPLRTPPLETEPVANAHADGGAELPAFLDEESGPALADAEAESEPVQAIAAE